MGSTDAQVATIDDLRASLWQRWHRIGYRIAYKLIQADRFLRPSHGRGVKLIMQDYSGRVMLVQHSYGSRHWTFPGGGVHTAESPLRAAERECLEELGIASTAFELLGTHPARSRRRIDVVSVFTERGIRPEGLTPNPVELASVGWFTRKDLPAQIDPNVATALGLLDGRNAELAASHHHAT